MDKLRIKHNCWIVNLRFCCCCCCCFGCCWGDGSFYFSLCFHALCCDSIICIVEWSIFAVWNEHLRLLSIINRPCGRTGRYRIQRSYIHIGETLTKKTHTQKPATKKAYPINTNKFCFYRSIQCFREEISRCWKWIISVCLMTFGFILFSQFRYDYSAERLSNVIKREKKIDRFSSCFYLYVFNTAMFIVHFLLSFDRMNLPIK